MKKNNISYVLSALLAILVISIFLVDKNQDSQVQQVNKIELTKNKNLIEHKKREISKKNILKDTKLDYKDINIKKDIKEKVDNKKDIEFSNLNNTNKQRLFFKKNPKELEKRRTEKPRLTAKNKKRINYFKGRFKYYKKNKNEIKNLEETAL